jgi:hypothetical protein
MKIANKHHKLSPEAGQNPCPAEGLKILARMISRACMAKHIITGLKENSLEVNKPGQRLTGSRKNDIPHCSR